MNSLIVLLVSLIIFFLAYRFYALYLSRRLFNLNDKNKTPAHALRDDVDYVPARRGVLFGHHFASIAGLGPILGPAIAVIWGWMPAVLWIVFGSVMLGAVHDFTTLVVSEKHEGRSLGYIAGNIINRRARNLFMILIFFLLSLAMGTFVFVLTKLFALYPESVLPIGLLMIIAVSIGLLVYKKNVPLVPVTVVGVILAFAGLFLGQVLPVSGVSDNLWIVILLAYAFLASILPVWLLLQPRDYINSFQLFISMGLLMLGVLIFHPVISAPAVHTPAGNPPPVFPFLFITIACGAISGFHNLVSSGTTVKQLNRESDSLSIGYGGMLMEGLLALIVVIATTAAVGGRAEWIKLYGDWGRAKGLEPQLKAFVGGASNILSHVGIPLSIGVVFITVVIVSFAMTTLDTATRLLRYNIQEIGNGLRVPILQNKFLASIIAVLAIGGFAVIKINGKPAGVLLWQLFGTGNQLLAALGLLTVSIYLYKRGKPIIYTAVPFVLMIVVTIGALVMNLLTFSKNMEQNKAIFSVGLVILLLSVWLLVEAGLIIRKLKPGRVDSV